MSTARRIKAPAAPARPRILDIAAAEDALARIAEIRADKAEAERAFEVHVAELRRPIDAAAAVLDAEEAVLVAAVQDWAEANRRKLTNDGKRKSLHIGAGRIGWAKGKDRIEIEKGEEAEARILDAIRAAGLVQFIRTKDSINKQAMLDDPKLALTFAGVALVEGVEAFFVEPGAKR